MVNDQEDGQGRDGENTLILLWRTVYIPIVTELDKILSIFTSLHFTYLIYTGIPN